MKKYLLLILMMLFSVASFSQSSSFYTLDFEDTAVLHHLRIDTVSNLNNNWQVGAPQKTIFTNAYSNPNVIVTDTINPYPINDTSSFTIVNVAGDGFTYPHTASLIGEYSVNSDTLTDFGTIEFSPDNGTSWYDIINDTFITNHIYLQQHWISLTGNSNGWQQFYVNLAPLGPLFNIQLGDTVLWRFTFISDSIQTNKDGVMFDNLYFEDYVESIPEIQNDNLISISPNPTSNELRIYKSNVSDSQKVQVLNYRGQVLYDNSNFIGDRIDIRQLPNGIYLLKYAATKYFSVKKFVVQH
ncbi:MAG: T9SS type A sorting domain-containing protein [Bacteroidetes bacterium]|nr:T9SS type A sorting domain-containing protein [Bacteroidota bacterium]